MMSEVLLTDDRPDFMTKNIVEQIMGTIEK